MIVGWPDTLQEAAKYLVARRDPADGVWGRKKTLRLPGLAFGRAFGLVRVKFVIFLILPDPECPMDPKVGSHSDCVAPWGTTEGFRSIFHVLGPPQTSFGVPARRSHSILGSFVRQILLENSETFQTGFCRTQGALGTPW